MFKNSQRSDNVLSVDFYKSIVDLFGFNISGVLVENERASACDDFHCDSILRGVASEFIVKITLENVVSPGLSDLLVLQCLINFFQPAHMRINIVLG